MGHYDIALRHVARRHPEDLARALLPPGVPFDVVGWFDTQLTLVERRSDKALDLSVAGERRLLHLEIAAGMDADDADRFHEYNGLLLLALRREVSGAPRAPKPKPPEGSARPKPRAPVPVLTMVILLSGRKETWPEEVAYATGWPELAFSGAHFRVEAVYQRTVAELRARGGLLWLVFTPLATDASAPAMREVLTEIRARVPEAGPRRDLLTALFVLAGLDPWGHNLKEEIKAMMEADDLFDFEETMRNSVLRERFLAGKQEGEQNLLSGVFARQAGHAPTPDEQKALAKRAKELGPEEAVMALVRLHGDALVAWLLGDGRAPEHAG